MGKTRQRIYQITITIAMLVLVISMSGCTGSTGKDDTHLLSGLNDRVVETVLENDEARDVITASDVVINQMFYGSFSGPEAEEVLVACGILNMPHVGGLGRMAIIILEVDSMNVVAYDEIPADEVWVSSLPMSNGQDRIIFQGNRPIREYHRRILCILVFRTGNGWKSRLRNLRRWGKIVFIS